MREAACDTEPLRGRDRARRLGTVGPRAFFKRPRLLSTGTGVRLSLWSPQVARLSVTEGLAAARAQGTALPSRRRVWLEMILRVMVTVKRSV